MARDQHARCRALARSGPDGDMSQQQRSAGRAGIKHCYFRPTSRRQCPYLSPNGQNEMEQRSAFAVRRRGNVTAMTLDDTLADRQS